MNKQEQKELSYFPIEIDNAIIERFGEEVEPKTLFDYFGDMNYHTTFKAKGNLKIKIEEFISGYIAGNIELANRLKNLKQF